MENFGGLIGNLTKHTENLPVFKDFSQKTGISTGYLSLGLVAIIAGLVFIGIGADLVTDLIGMFYPIYMSFKALETKAEDDDKLWLTYWVVYAVYKVIDGWAEIFIYWIPFYHPIKLSFLIFLFAPQTRGAEQLYTSFIRPFMIKHQEEIDQGMSSLEEAANLASKIAKEEAIKKGTVLIAESYSKKD